LANMREIVEKFHKLDQQYELAGQGDKVESQHKKGKLHVRERIQMLFDPGTFVELDKFVEHHCSNFGMEKRSGVGDGVITGYGKIDGRLVYAYADDFTVFGGTQGEMNSKKICKMLDMALESGCPVISIHDSGGGRIQEGVDAKHAYGEIFYRNSIMSGVVPQISAIIGPCAGGAVYSPALTDFIIMVNQISHMFVTGPKVCKSALNEDVTEEQLGGAISQSSISGVTHLMAKDEPECFTMIHKLLSYIPSSNKAPLPVTPENLKDQVLDQLLDIVPADKNLAYDIKAVINCIFDKDSFFEIQPLYALNIVVGFARLNGSPVGIIANQPKFMAGCIDINASDKAARFIRFCDAFNIPIISLVDVPGYLPGINQEHGGIIRHGAKLLYAYSEATVPKITMVLRKAYGGAQNAMCSKELRADHLILWPTAEIAVMGAEAAVKIIFRKEIAKAENPEQLRAEKIAEYNEKFSTPLAAARRGYADRIIEPQNSRIELIKALESVKNKHQRLPWKKHGNIPL
jgi:acetyl-CoA carboxylase carboxyltransferase component